MVYTETGVFKRYKRNRKDKDGNYKEVIQVGVSGLSVNSKFDDDEEIVIISKEEFTNMETKLTTQTKNIQSLENQLNQAKEESTESPKYTNKVIELQETINNRNGLLMNTQNTINSIFNEAGNHYNKVGTQITKANTETQNNIITLLSELQTEVNTILDLANELPNQANGINQQVKNMNWFKYAISKNKINIVLDMDILNEVQAKLTEFTNKDIVQLANKLITPVEIPTGKLDELTTEDLDLTELYINFEETNTNEPIPIKLITPDTK